MRTAPLLAALLALSAAPAASAQPILPGSQALAPGVGGVARHAARLERWADPHWQSYADATPPADALNLYAEVVSTLGRLYVDREAARPEKLFAAGLDELALAFSDETFALRNLEPASPGERRRQLDGFAGRGPSSAAEARQLAFDLVRQLQVRVGVKHPSAVVFELVAGACAGLDDYTSFVPPVVTRSQVAEFFAGHGLAVRLARGRARVEASGVPGFEPGDEIVKLNGAAVADLLADPQGRALAPAAGADHAAELATGEVRRLRADPAALTSRFDDARPGVAVIRLAAFRSDTADALRAVLARLAQSGMRSLVLDLRGNRGGSFPAALGAAGLFLDGGAVARTDGQSPEFAAREFAAPAHAAWRGPVVVLVDGGTASASEVVAAALSERGRAVVVGQKTYGKGVVQSGPVHLQSGSLVVTLATVTGPAGREFDRAGVTPGIRVEGEAAQLSAALERASGMGR